MYLLFKESKKQALYCLLIEPTKQSFVKIRGIALLRHALHNFFWNLFNEYLIAWLQLYIISLIANGISEFQGNNR